jgi:hypothetical protein
MKQCITCSETNPDQFYPRALKCKKCCIARQREWALQHPEKVQKYFEKFKKENPERYKLSKRKYFEKNRELLCRKSNEWRKTHREYWNQYIRDFKQRNPNYMLSEKLRARIRSALKGTPRSSDIQTLLGCDYTTFRQYIQSKFQAGMTWNNFGEWHIDHIRPCSKFDLTYSSEQSKCFHYTNMQPLWAKDNLQKYTH